MRVDVKNYFIFSAVIALVIAFILNFGFFETFKSSFINGFPISLNGSDGLGKFFIQIVNTLISALFFTPAVYLLIKYLERRR